ncbi:hypothetical protein R6Q59_007918 [Mikania micrantha]|uniref:RING-type E3 ubiquitin transferase n=1 Tax=Mikania micrantha TaxID=192012 RepID=A0A5N6Q1K7_9ASTR|nr:hypothetical protein E3N88_01615 [Mikania micrantha]
MEFSVSFNNKPCKFCDHEYAPQPPPPPPPIPPPPPPPPPMNDDLQSLPPILIIMFGVFSVSFSFICYLTCAKICRMRQRNRRITDHEAREDVVNEDLGPVIHNPIWLINTRGLDQSQIESIHVFKYKRDERLIEGTDCSICLSEFEDDERLRLLPKCSHAFHIPCIDTWLRSHKNCPLCRALIIKNVPNHDQTENPVTESDMIESSTTTEETEIPPVHDSQTTDDHRAVEVESNAEIAKNSGILDENAVENTPYSSNGSRVRADTDHLADHHHVQGKELVLKRQLVVSKKPSSMPKSGHKLHESRSSSSIHMYRKPKKSSSFGQVSSRIYNQSY